MSNDIRLFVKDGITVEVMAADAAFYKNAGYVEVKDEPEPVTEPVPDTKEPEPEKKTGKK